MEIPHKYQKYCIRHQAGTAFRLEDDKTSLYAKTGENEVWSLRIDHGVISDKEQGQQKCDFMVYDEYKKKSHLIELKGMVIDRAINQLSETVTTLKHHEEVSFLVRGQKKVYAYIVSPGQQKMPRGGDSKKRELARKLAGCSTQKVEDIFELIKFVKVVKKTNAKNMDKYQMICSPKDPLIF